MYSSWKEAYPNHGKILLPCYVKPIASTTPSAGVQYLLKKTAFKIPAVSHRNELLRCYIQYVHPFAPVVDLQQFLSPMWKNNAAERISLLLLHAVMFAGTAYINRCYLKAQGFKTRKAARAAYFTRVKLLYKFYYERNRLVIVQALLLMTEWAQRGEDLKDSSFWLGEAISVGKTIGLNANSSNAPMSISRQRLWRRLWWTCHTRDRLLAIGTQRPLLMSDVDINIPMLGVSDFETDALPLELNCMLGSISVIGNSSTRTLSAGMCVKLTKLSVCIGRVLETQYSIPDHNSSFSATSIILLAPKTFLSEASDI
jgi:hypothetical protein